jgi:hypothetical protein
MMGRGREKLARRSGTETAVAGFPETSALLSDIACLNAMLASGVTFTVEEERPEAVLELKGERGLKRSVSRRLRLAAGRRRMRLALSSCLAECAMDLGLGAAVCRRRART